MMMIVCSILPLRLGVRVDGSQRCVGRLGRHGVAATALRPPEAGHKATKDATVWKCRSHSSITSRALGVLPHLATIPSAVHFPAHPNAASFPPPLISLADIDF
jgi:hypothetical protein